jgi:hypothetical protein
MSEFRTAKCIMGAFMAMVIPYHTSLSLLHLVTTPPIPFHLNAPLPLYNPPKSVSPFSSLPVSVNFSFKRHPKPRAGAEYVISLLRFQQEFRVSFDQIRSAPGMEKETPNWISK